MKNNNKKNEKVLGVIPARIGSTRLKRKMLLQIDGKPLIYHTLKQAKKAKLLDAVVVATDSKEIYEAVLRYGGEVIMTSKNIKTGSDRTAKAASLFEKFNPTIVLNIQGDEPMMPESAINKTVKLLLDDRDAVMSTVATPLIDKKELTNPGVVKVILDKKSNAIYFSRHSLPYPREPYTKYLKHLGLYGYRFNFLKKYVKLAQTPLEKAELLEQLRALENGYKIKVGVGSYERVEVNTKEEFEIVKRLIENRSKKK